MKKFMKWNKKISSLLYMAPAKVSVNTKVFKTGSKYTRTGKHRSKYSSRRFAKATISKPLKNAIQAMISKDAETKITMFSSNYTNYNQQINSAEALRLLPDITNGTGGNQKLGNKIKLQKLRFRGVVSFQLPQASIPNCRIGIRFIIMRLKKFDDWNASNADLATNYVKLLEGTNTGIDGTIAAHNTPLNLDYCTKVMDKRMYMSFSNTSGTAIIGDIQQATKFLNFSIPHSRRILNYDENNSSNQPVDYPYFALISYCKLDGSAADLPATAYLGLQYTVKAEFEDA